MQTTEYILNHKFDSDVSPERPPTDSRFTNGAFEYRVVVKDSLSHAKLLELEHDLKAARSAVASVALAWAREQRRSAELTQLLEAERAKVRAYRMAEVADLQYDMLPA